MSDKPVIIMSGTILPTDGYVHKKAAKKQADFSKLFEEQVNKFKEASETVANQDSHSARRDMEARKNIERNPQTKIDWEQVALPKHASDLEKPTDIKSITPSMSGESADGGRGHLPNTMPSIFNPGGLEEAVNSEFTNHVIAAGDKKRHEAEDKKERNREWENIEAQKARSTDEASPSQMGFTPHRTAFEPAPLPKVNIKEINEMKANNEASALAGKEAAKIYTKLANIFEDNQRAAMADTRSWEEQQIDRISSIENRPMNVEPNNIKLAEDFTKPPTKIENSLEGVFTMPQNPEEVVEKEASIKRETKHLQTKRTARRDDRSWETLENARSRKS